MNEAKLIKRVGERDVNTMKKAPQAPKRFKSSYILYFTAKQDQIKKELGSEASASDVARKASEMWKTVKPEERLHWETEAQKDKDRYSYEKAHYHGPWHVVKNPNRRTKKDPSAPKRNPSAFLLFCQQRRPEIKAKNPGMKTTEITCILGEIWRSQLTPADKKDFVDREAIGREKYKKDMAEWKRRQAQQKLIQETELQNSLNVSGMSGNPNPYARAASAWEQARLAAEQAKSGIPPQPRKLTSHGERYSEYYPSTGEQYPESYSTTTFHPGAPYARPSTTSTSGEDNARVSKYDYTPRPREQPATANVAAGANVPPSPMRSYPQNENMEYFYRQQYTAAQAHRGNAEDRTGKAPVNRAGRSVKVEDYEPFPI